jgi:hypothetical protein
MNLFISLLILIVPGIIAVSIHEKQLIHITRDNWQSLLWKFLLYSFGIIFIVSFVLYLRFPERTVSFSPWTIWTSNNVYQVSFVFKYMLFATVAALILPKLWGCRNSFLKKLKERKSFKITDDE